MTPSAPFEAVHVVGLGAVGTLLAVAFAKTGIAVHSYRGRGSRFRHLRASYRDRDEILRVSNHRRAIPRVRGNDAVLIAVKWPQLQPVLAVIARRLTRANPLLLPQNGLVDRELAAFASDLNLMPVIVHVAAHRERRGTVVAHTEPQFLICRSADLPRSAGLHRVGFHFLDAREFAVAQRIKLLIACTSAKMALTGLSIGEAFADCRMRKELVAIVREAATVLIMDAGGDQHLKTEADALIGRISSGSLVDTAATGSAYTSLHQDLHVRHQATEAPWLNGLVVRLGRRLGLETPVNAALMSSLIRLERRRSAVEPRRRGFS